MCFHFGKNFLVIIIRDGAERFTLWTPDFSDIPSKDYMPANLHMLLIFCYVNLLFFVFFLCESLILSGNNSKMRCTGFVHLVKYLLYRLQSVMLNLIML